MNYCNAIKVTVITESSSQRNGMNRKFHAIMKKS